MVIKFEFNLQTLPVKVMDIVYWKVIYIVYHKYAALYDKTPEISQIVKDADALKFRLLSEYHRRP